MKYNWGFILTPLLKFIRQVSFVVYPLELFFQHDEKISWEISHNFLSLKLWKSIGKQIRKKIEILLTINFHVIIDESWWRRAYLNFNEKFIHSFMLLSINFIQLQLSLYFALPDIHTLPRRFFVQIQFLDANCLDIESRRNISNHRNMLFFQLWEVLDRSRHFFVVPMRPARYHTWRKEWREKS